MFTCCRNWMFLASRWLEIYIDIQNGYFADSEQFKAKLISILLTLGKLKLTLFVSFYWLGQVTLILLSLGKTCRKKQSKQSPFDNGFKKNSRTTNRIWGRSFSMIQSAGIKNWFPQSINRLFISFWKTLFWFLWQNKICMIRIKTQKVL